MEETIYNLLRASISELVDNTTIREMAKKIDKEKIIELARAEIKRIQYFIKIELPEWNYWKDKEQKLMELIVNLQK